MKKTIISVAFLAICNLLNAQTTSSCPQLIFKLGNGMTRMPSAALKSLTEARVEMSDWSSTDFSLQEFTIIALFSKTQTYKTIINKGSQFNEETKLLLNSIRPNDSIIVTAISAINKSGTVVSVQNRNLAFY